MVELLPSLFQSLRQLSIGRIGMSFSYAANWSFFLSVIHVVLMLSRMPLGTIEYSLPARLLRPTEREIFLSKGKEGIVLFFLFILGWPIALFFLEGIFHYVGLFPVSPRGLFWSFFSWLPLPDRPSMGRVSLSPKNPYLSSDLCVGAFTEAKRIRIRRIPPHSSRISFWEWMRSTKSFH